MGLFKWLIQLVGDPYNLVVGLSLRHGEWLFLYSFSKKHFYAYQIIPIVSKD